MQSHKIEWREVTVGELNDYIVNGFDTEKPFPYAVWLVSVDGIPIDDVNAKTKLAIMPEVMDFLASMTDSIVKFSIQRMNVDGSSSSESMEDTIESSTET